MIQGALNWKDRNALYDQTNNAWETAEPGLDQCNCSMDAIARAALVKDYESFLQSKNVYGGLWHEQPEDSIANFYRDPRNRKLLQSIRMLDIGGGPGQVRPERVPQYRPAAMKAIFNIEAQFFMEGGTFERVAKLVWEGNVVGLCLKNPGHYICAVAFDDQTRQIAFKDPWPGDPWPGTKTDPSIPDQDNNKWMSAVDFRNVEPWYILYHK